MKRRLPHISRFLVLLLATGMLVATLSSCGSFDLQKLFIEDIDEQSSTLPPEGNGDGGSESVGGASGGLGLPEDTTFYYADRVATAETAGAVAEVANRVRHSVVEVYTPDGAGSGVFISSDGVILTCYHVVEGASSIEVVTVDGERYDALLYGSDTWSDLAILKITAEKSFPYATFARSANADSSCIVVGETVIAIGNSLGSLGGSITSGIIAGISREIAVEGVPMTLIQTDATVSPGNSGGGLFNLYGELVGIVNAKSVAASAGEIGFAIPSDTALYVADQLAKNGYVENRPYLGISFQTSSGYLTVASYDYNDELAELNPELPEGFTIQAGDIVAAADDIDMSTLSTATMTNLRSALSKKAIGDTMTLTIYRRVGQIFYGQYKYDTYTVKVYVHAFVPEGK